MRMRHGCLSSSSRSSSRYGRRVRLDRRSDRRHRARRARLRLLIRVRTTARARLRLLSRRRRRTTRGTRQLRRSDRILQGACALQLHLHSAGQLRPRDRRDRVLDQSPDPLAHAAPGSHFPALHDLPRFPQPITTARPRSARPSHPIAPTSLCFLSKFVRSRRRWSRQQPTGRRQTSAARFSPQCF